MICHILHTPSRNGEESPKFPQYFYFDGKEEDDKELENNHIKNLPFNDTKSSNDLLSKSDIEKFFDLDFNFQQQKGHSLEESVCKPLIGKQKDKPFFYYCKEHQDVESIHLESIEDHIRLKDPEHHKAKLIELLQLENNNKSKEY
jgi:hypothetical protein